MRPGGVGGRLSALRPPRQVHWPCPALRVPPSSGRGGDGGGPPRSPGKRAQPCSALTAHLAPSPTPRPPTFSLLCPSSLIYFRRICIRGERTEPGTVRLICMPSQPRAGEIRFPEKTSLAMGSPFLNCRSARHEGKGGFR